MSKDLSYLDINDELIETINKITGVENWRLIDMHPQEVIVFIDERSIIPPMVKHDEKWRYINFQNENIVAVFTTDADNTPNYGVTVWVPNTTH